MYKKGMRVCDEDSNNGVIKTCKDLHNIEVEFDNGGFSLYCVVDGCGMCEILNVVDDTSMKLTFLNRLKLCFEIMTITSGHKHTAQEKALSTFLKGYRAGMEDGKAVEREAQRSLQCEM